MRSPIPPHVRGYRLLLWFFPRDVRVGDGDEMTRVFAQQYARVHGWARWWLCLRAIADAARHGLAERGERRRPTGAGQARVSGRAAVSGRWIDMLIHDVRYALRLLVRQPGIALAILVTLALGIGANTAVFSVVHAVLLRPLPYPEPDRLVMIWEKRPAEGVFNNVVSPADFLDWQRMATSFAGMAAYSRFTVDLTGVGEPTQVDAAAVTATFFDVLGVRALHGRTFAPDEDVLGNHRVAVLSHALWQRRFGADPAAAGRRIDLNGLAFEIIGVLPRTFEFPDGTADVWLPDALRGGKEAPPRASHSLTVYARLAPGATLESARAEMDRVGRDLEAAYPDQSEGHGAHVVSLRDEIVGPARNGLLVTMSAVAFLLLMACTNVANLLLARGAGRRREMAIRSAVGAARGRLVRQALTESLVMSAIGTAAGLVLAWWAIRLIVNETPPALRAVGMARAQLDMPVLVFTGAVCVIAALIAGLLPAWHVARALPAGSLREGGRSQGAVRRGLRFALIATEVALTVLLLIGAGLMIRSFVRVLAQPPGIETDHRLTLNLALPRSRYPDADALRRVRRALDERFGTTPGVIAAGATSHLPLTGADSRGGITVEGMVRTEGDAPVRAHPRFVTPGYLEAAGIEVRRGRAFTEADTATAPIVVVINETMARRYWPGQDAIGKRMRFNWEGDAWREVVGIVEDVRHWGLDREVNPEAYLPFDQVPSSRLTYVLHTEGEPTQVAGVLTAHVRAVDPNLPIGMMRTMDSVAAGSVAARRWWALLLGMFAGLGLLLAAAGIYGVLAHLVSTLTGEIGIRMMLGARPAALLRRVLGEALLHAGAGLLVGLALAVAAMHGLNAMLFEISAYDPATFAGSVIAVLAVVVLAATIPAVRAMRVDPAAALRE